MLPPAPQPLSRVQRHILWGSLALFLLSMLVHQHFRDTVLSMLHRQMTGATLAWILSLLGQILIVITLAWQYRQSSAYYVALTLVALLIAIFLGATLDAEVKRPEPAALPTLPDLSPELGSKIPFHPPSRAPSNRR